MDLTLLKPEDFRVVVYTEEDDPLHTCIGVRCQAKGVCDLALKQQVSKDLYAADPVEHQHRALQYFINHLKDTELPDNEAPQALRPKITGSQSFKNAASTSSNKV